MTDRITSSPFRDTIGEITERCRAVTDGANADYIPCLATVDPELWATAVTTPDGDLYPFGDCEHEFSIQSISKPLVYGLAIEELGLHEVLRRVGVEPSGEAFNSIALSRTGRPVNPMINAGALTVHGMLHDRIHECSSDDPHQLILDGLSRLAGRQLRVDDELAADEIANNYRNLAIANLLRSADTIEGNPRDVYEGYCRQCSIMLSVRDLAMIGATLASGGINPVSGERVLRGETVQWVLSVMSTCGMYDSAGSWMNTVGIPAKSGVSGGILGVIPGQMAIATFSPRLDEVGTSLRGARFFQTASQELGLHMMRITGRPTGALRNRAVVDFDDDGVRDTTLLRLYGDIDFASYESIDRAVTDGAYQRTTLFLDLVEVRSISRVARIHIEKLLCGAAGPVRVFVHDPADLLAHDICAEVTWVDAAQVREYSSTRAL
ncbi:glutaminase A [Corynebacterium sp. TAE3-ERU12]|uniref:glutaminase A n=1 Tax=Corynebacterium sp. TAE3-ERU12 TaxID=2849491 RepID=UPI001C44428A|nr:glutaminase A [Corynebacterium sp. TAE3-ERU12]MBV7295820.1 glutaminase A [Corynebacterium sp. TAE3-ERU12]